ncbi:MAG: hypothetical protein AB1Z98_31670 [Nannocystaceae bacterium]
MSGALGLSLAGVLAGVLAAQPEPEPPTGRSPAADVVALSWEAPPGCADEAAVRRILAAYLGGETSMEAAAAVRAVATVVQVDDGFSLRLRTETPSGVTTRETTEHDCAVLVEATALIVAIAVDPSVVVGRAEVPPTPVTEPEPDPEPGSEPDPVEVESKAGPSSPEPEPRPLVSRSDGEGIEPLPVRFGMRASGGVDLGVLPAVAGGLRLAGAVLGRGWRAEARGDVWLPRTAIAEEGLGARISMASGGLRGCGVPTVARRGLEFPLCGGLELGAMRGDPVGARVENGATVRRLWLAADASAGLAWAPRRYLALWVQTELVVPIVRAGFRVGDIPVHRAGPVGGRAMLGLEARFP